MSVYRERRKPRDIALDRRCLVLAALAAAVVVLIGCPREREKKDEPARAASTSDGGEDEHDAIPRRAKLTPRIIADARIAWTPAKREVLAATIALAGELAADPDKSARVASPVAGRLTEVRFAEGSEVKRGDVLALLRIPDIGKVRAAFNATTAKSAAARANADRLDALAEKGMAAKQEAVAARAEANALDAEAKAVAEELGALGMSASGDGALLALRAPLGGTVVARDAVVGQPVATDQTIASIADLRELWFLARVFEKDLGKLDTGAAADVTLNAFPNESFGGKVEYVSRQIDPAARTVTARIRLTNRDELLRIGLFGSARVVTKAEKPGEAGLVVPRTAIIDVAGKTVVFVHVGGEEFELHEVTVGDGAAGRVRILSGLREGEEVVSDGAFTIKSVLLRGTLADED
ncbi:MAG: efflux RND transporter periplasmic adaptor subunit [Labilithrix sp.]|nr:efflux RND transporter periplasmic adaptor subunit [Labilithrix sp.]MCW5817058.1 efflux RND transporter periplasmic adaptor subunit [Labilithrix sp.]